VEGSFEQSEQQCNCQLLKKGICAPRSLLFFPYVGFDVYDKPIYTDSFFKSGSEYSTLVAAQQLLSSALRSVVLP